MRDLPAAFLAHCQLGTTTIAWALEVTRTDDEVYRFTSLDRDSIIDGQTFSAHQGLLASEIVSSGGLAVDNLELSTLDDLSLFDKTDILQGRWRNAAFRLMRYNFSADPITEANDVEVVRAGTFGEIGFANGMITVELRDISQYLQQPVGDTSTKTCRARLGSTTGIRRCMKDLTDFTHNGTVTAVTSKRQFTSGLGQASGYYQEGIITWLTGGNAGLSAKVRSFASGEFVLILPLVATIQIGDTFTAVAGCLKTAEVCHAKFENILNFQGEPHRPLQDELSKPAAPA